MVFNKDLAFFYLSNQLSLKVHTAKYMLPFAITCVTFSFYKTKTQYLSIPSKLFHIESVFVNKSLHRWFIEGQSKKHIFQRTSKLIHYLCGSETTSFYSTRLFLTNDPS